MKLVHDRLLTAQQLPRPRRVAGHQGRSFLVDDKHRLHVSLPCLDAFIATLLAQVFLPPRQGYQGF
jgi:hypothetical protein